MLYILNFINVLLLSVVLICIVFILVIVSFTVGYKDIEPIEMTSYECGFVPFSEARIQFNIKFYLISTLFILFDLEIVLLFPFTVTISQIGFFGYFVVIFFTCLLTLAFIYEWKNKSFNFIDII